MAEDAAVMEDGLPPAKRVKMSDDAGLVPEPQPSADVVEQRQRPQKKKSKKGGGWRKRQDEAKRAAASAAQDTTTPTAAADNRSSGWSEYSLENETLLRYYREQAGIVPAADWATFEAYLRKDLPSTFRVSGIVAEQAHLPQPTQTAFPLQRRAVQRLDRTYAAAFAASEHFKLAPLAWFPHRGAWQFSVPPRKLKRENMTISAEAESLKPVIHEFHEFLVAASQIGAVTRQEAVSMIPVMFMDLHDTHWVLDMCAAPGSKTTQLLEALHASSTTPFPAGVVVANDANPQRCNTLISQAKRLNSPCLLVTHHEAQLFPNPRGGSDSLPKQRPILYDRILCDVPCSGDGTIRKTPEIWSRWTPNGGLGLHVIQIRILMRAFHLLRPGSSSRIVYSTCSLNPVEDEAVIAQVLLQSKGALELVDISADALRYGLRFQPGISQWRVMDKSGTWFSQYDDIPEAQRGAIQATHFPPSETPFPLHLERCCRFLPHMQDTGGFFVAVLRPRANAVLSNSQIPASIVPTEELVAESSSLIVQRPSFPPRPKPSKASIARNDLPYFPPPPSALNDIWPLIVDFFGILPTFPVGQLLTRSDQLAKLYLLSPSAKALFDADTTSLLRFKHMGIRLFERMAGSNTSAAAVDADEDIQDVASTTPELAIGPSRCGYRVCQEGVQILAHPLMTNGRRVVKLCLADLIQLLSRKDMSLGSFAQDTATCLETMEVGSIVFVVAEDPTLCFAGWRGSHSCHLRLSQADKKAYQMLLTD